MADAPLPDPMTKQDILREFARNPRLAHAAVFRHRHTSETPAFHYEIIDAWWSDHPFVVTEAFRGGAKSTLAEEAIVLMACFGLFRNCIILGESEQRANERLGAIKHEIATNEYLNELFGDMVGPVWKERKIILSNGVVIQAFGREQSLRGAKHLQDRPDLAFGDDMEDDESVASPEGRKKVQDWWMKVVRPAMAPNSKIRVAGTPLDPEALLVKFKVQPDCRALTFPLEHVDTDTGERKATWESRFPLPWVDALRTSYENMGSMQEFMQEYMCQATDPASRSFTADMIKVEPTVRTWHAVHACFDPARTVKKTSALTGWAAWSWIGNRLVIWDADGGLWRPDEIIDKMFQVQDKYNPVLLGVEEDGLHEFILQPLRQQQLARNEVLPVHPLKAPKGKLDFIRGLQPFFKAGEVVFAQDLPKLKAQLLSFPTGQIDIPNALAYALRMRPGAAVYDGFTLHHIVEDLMLTRDTVWLAVNASAQFTTAAMVQFVKGGLHVTRDWVREGDIGVHLSDILRDAQLESAREVRLVAGPAHFGTHDTVGLRGAARRIPATVHRGGDTLRGREVIRGALSASTHGIPALLVSSKAKWTLNAMSGGYARAVTRAGVLSEFAVEGPYRTLMEGLEAFAALTGTSAEAEDRNVRYATAADGRRYISARAVG